MSRVPKRGPPTSALSKLNWRFLLQPSHRPSTDKRHSRFSRSITGVTAELSQPSAFDAPMRLFCREHTTRHARLGLGRILLCALVVGCAVAAPGSAIPDEPSPTLEAYVARPDESFGWR